MAGDAGLPRIPVMSLHQTQAGYDQVDQFDANERRDHAPQPINSERPRKQRRSGLGRVFYADVTSFAEVRRPVLTCEVFLEPRNVAVLLFHGTYGFQEVGQRVMDETGVRVSMLAKELTSYPWVKERWLDGPG